MTMSETEGRASKKRTFRAVIERLGRDERQRVVPLPVALAAILFPFLAAWATAADGASQARWAAKTSAAAGECSAVHALDRLDRVATEGVGYVDIYGAPEPWECELLSRRGYVPPLASAECSEHAGRATSATDR